MSAEMAVSLALKLNDQGSGPATQALGKINRAMKEMESVAKSTSTAAVSAFQKLSSAREILGVRSEKAIQNEIRQTEAAYQRLAASGQAGARELSRAWDKSRESITRLKNEMGVLTTRQKALKAAENAPMVAAGAYAAYRMIAAPIKKYADLEQAQTDLRISMTNKDGRVSPEYNKTLAVAQDLGNKLPGSTRDFVLEAQALKQKGIDDRVISGEGLRAAGLLRVGMHMSGTGEAGQLVAESMHSYGLKDNELVGAADHTYRLHKAFGAKGGEITESNTYMSSTLNQLGWAGLESMKKVQAMQGYMAMRGMNGSVFGTNFSDMLSFAARAETRLKGKGAETKEVREILGKHGISLDLFDKKGKFVGPDEFLKQLEKLRVLSQKELVETLHKIFGTQGERPAMALVTAGQNGVKEAEDKVDEQLSLAEAVKQQTETFAGKAEALSGSIENMLAELGRPIGESLKPVLDKLNEIAGAATDFFKDNPMVAATAVLTAAAVAMGATAGLISMFLRGGIGLPVRVVNLGGGGLPGSPGGAPTSGPVPPGSAAPAGTSLATRLLPLGIATAPLAVMGAVAFAADWTEKPGNAEKVVGVGQDYVASPLKSFLRALGFDKDGEIEARRAQNREGFDTTGQTQKVEVVVRVENGNIVAGVNEANARTASRH